MVIAVVVLRSIPRAVSACKVIEIKPAGPEFVMADFVLSPRVHGHQDASVPAKDVVDVPDIVDRITVQTVVEGYAAYVRTKFFVDPSPEWRTAFRTGSF